MEDKVFAAVGDLHGHMHLMVNLLQGAEYSSGRSISFVLQVGDFQPLRDEKDLETMAVPSKYRSLGDFPDFYSGKSSFPWPVWFIGGNHEPYGYLDSYPKGAPLIHNCNYMGREGSFELDGLKISGLSGVYSEKDYSGPPISRRKNQTDDLKQHGHFREEHLEELIGKGRLDILLLHDWPSGLACGDMNNRFSDRGEDILRTAVEMLEPSLLLCGHQHHNFQTSISHQSGKVTQVHCLAEVNSPNPGIALFSYGDNGEIVRIE